MTAYNVIAPTTLQAGQPEDVSVILANLQAIAQVINGGIDNANIHPAAAIVASKLAGYPSDPTKSLLGDGSWGVTAVGIPPGVTVPYAVATAPGGWLICDGQLISRVTYSALFAAIGVVFGAGDGSTTFAVPDLRGRAVYGIGGAGTDSLGANEGQASIPNRGPHHPHSVADPGHSHNRYWGSIGGGVGDSNGRNAEGLYGGITAEVTGITVGPAGYSTVNAPSHIALNYIIKT